jgi:ketosteroid isomerase-like protein
MLRSVLRAVPALALATSLAACSPPPTQTAQRATPPAPAPPPPISQATVEQSVQDTVAALAAGDAAKAGAMYASDATFMNARGKFDGQAGIQTFWAEALKAGAGKGLALQTVKSGTSGDLAYTVSRFTGGITASSGYTVGITERQPDGSLKIIVQMSLPDPPAAK